MKSDIYQILGQINSSGYAVQSSTNSYNYMYTNLGFGSILWATDLYKYQPVEK